MNRTVIFSFRVSVPERQAIAKLAARLERSQSDAVRFLVMQTARELLRSENCSIDGWSAEATDGGVLVEARHAAG